LGGLHASRLEKIASTLSVGEVGQPHKVTW
jgi:hypothetical protein